MAAGKLTLVSRGRGGHTNVVRSYRRRRSMRRTNKPGAMTARRCPTITPRAQLVKLRYALSDGITSTAGSIGMKEFRLNSLYDTDYTGIGHKPRGTQEWGAMFYHCTVLASKIVAFFTPITSLSNTVGVNLRLKGDTGAPSDLDQIYESRRVKSGWMLPDQGRRVALSMFVNLRKHFNVPSVQGDSRFVATINTNPTEELIWELTAMDFNSGTTTVGLYGYIDYYVMWSEPKQLPQTS